MSLLTKSSSAEISQILADTMDLNITHDDLFRLFDASIKNQQFTVMKFYSDAMELERIYSTTPESYPVGGRKPKSDTAWGKRVLIDRYLNVGDGAGDIRWAFSDSEKILGLGLTNVLNVPVVIGERVTGTLNFLRSGCPFDEKEQVIGQLLAAALATRQVMIESES